MAWRRQRIIYSLSGGVRVCRSAICHKCRVVCARFSGGEKCRRKRAEKQPCHGKGKTNAAFFRRMHQAFVQSRNIRPRDNCQQDKRNPIEPPCMTPCEQHDRRKDGQRGNRRNHHAPEVFRMRRTATHPEDIIAPINKTGAMMYQSARRTPTQRTSGGKGRLRGGFCDSVTKPARPQDSSRCLFC